MCLAPEPERDNGEKRLGESFETCILPINSRSQPLTTQRRQNCPSLPNVCSVEAEVVSPLRSRNYKVSATVGVSTVVATPVRVILDTGAGPNLVRAEILPTDWEKYRVAGAQTLQIVGAGGRRLKQSGAILLHLEICGLKTRMHFVVVPGLAAECILVCQFIDRHVKSILPKEEKVLLENGGVAAIIQDSELLQPGAEKETVSKSGPSTKVRVAKWTVLPPRSETHVWVQSESPGLRFLQAWLRTPSIGVYLSNGIAEIVPHKHFQVRVVNTSLKERRLPKQMVLGHALPHPKGIVSLVEDVAEVLKHYGRSELLSTEQGNTAPSDEKIPSILDRPEVDEELWKEQVDLAHLVPQERTKILDTLQRDRTMWDGRLGHAHTTHPRIEFIAAA
jgi:Retroviral aspartyl protease